MSTIQLLHNNLPSNTDMGEYWYKRSLVTDNWWLERKEYNARVERMKKKPIALYNSIDRMKHIVIFIYFYIILYDMGIIGPRSRWAGT